ncbi:glutaredoxin family protein [Virgibacillus sp. MSP4-1]|uniref:glutaredoxin family protein n=1 Tax=Virgibacillus sp. MSP4-1 TaxID=2700081 RepID=UPI0003A5A794|nr:glutaredoxin family protein [Virgibacillus sp. MSP4-1]QHS24107.1 glutaredoxin family protein [Virgibacillus sp. MSP4-1]
MTQKEVLLYTSDNCDQGRKIKQLLNDWNIPFQEKNISENRSYLKELQADKVYATPATYINGERVLGYQKEKLARLIGQYNI